MSDENILQTKNAREQRPDLFVHHPLIAAVLAQKTVRCNTFYEEDKQEQQVETEQQVKELPGQEGRDRSLFGSGSTDSSSSSKTISVMGCLKGAYDAYKYVNQVRSNGTYVGMAGSVGLIALKAISAIYGAQSSGGGGGGGGGSTSVGSTASATCSIGSLYWIALGAAVGIAVHSEARWWLTDQGLAQKHLSEAQRFAHILSDGEEDQVAENHASSKESAHDKHHKHRRRKRRLEQQ